MASDHHHHHHHHHHHALDDYHPPPPPRSPHAPPALFQQSQRSPLRRIAVQPPLLTTSTLTPPPLPPPPPQLLLHTPATATATSTLSLPFSPFSPLAAAHSPFSAAHSPLPVAHSPASYAPSPVPPSPMAARNQPAVPYNPQQWSRGGPVTGQHVHHAQTAVPSRLHDVTGMEASMPSPPPPYSPGQTPGSSHSLTASPHQSVGGFPQQHPPPPPMPPTSTPSSARPLTGFHSRPVSVVVPSSATSITSNAQFPPPPPRNGPGRSASRDKLVSKFSLSSFRNRNNEHSPGPSAIDSLHINTSDAIMRAPASPGLIAQRATSHYVPSALADRRYSPEDQSPLRAPTARRAASAGVPGYETRTPIDESPVGPQGSWSRSTPLPPPPPGPPPPSISRSQSMGPVQDMVRAPAAPSAPSAPPTRRPGQSTLGPIPPTPLGWQDEPVATRPRSPAARGLHVDTGNHAGRSYVQTAPPSDNGSASISSGPSNTTSHSGSTLYHTPQREQSSRGIRERRSESRAARSAVEPSNNPWAQDLEDGSTKPANLELGTPEGGLTRRGAVTRGGTPRSGTSLRSPRSAHLFEDPGSSNVTPRIESSQRSASGPAPTPPFSPGRRSLSRSAQKAPASLPAKSLPTPPLSGYVDYETLDLTRQIGSASRSKSRVSHTSDARTENATIMTPRPSQRDLFAQASVERHRQFIEKEMAATTDQDRLELFAEFIVTESRIRRDRYTAAFDDMAGDIMDLTRDMWRSYGTVGRRSATPNTQITTPRLSGKKSQTSLAGGSPDTRLSNSIPTTAVSPASSAGNFTPRTEPASPSSASSQKVRDTAWANNYHPSLSPIPSMAMSTVPDEEGSRGRSASRWWESDGGSSGIGGGRRLERSKRESKYMSLPKEARENLQWSEGHDNTPAQGADFSGQQSYGPNEYPPEKVGSHHLEPQAQLQASYGYYPRSPTATPDSHKLDVSRLVTLPPSYPRHHPAVNNSHPDLASIRTSLRTLTEFEEVKSSKTKFAAKIEDRKEQEGTSLSDRRAELRYNIQDNVRNGVMSFADAAKAEADFDAREHQRAQDVVQYIFDTFQAEVANPLHAIFCERITKATASMEHLKGRLSSEAQELNPNQMQEEGDEQPELVEMLTLLKWLFEAREQLHKEMFDLEDERNDLYRDIIVLPYVQQKNEQKVKEATSFFQRDAQDRKVTFEKGVLKRYEDLMNVIEQNVTRGVEAQLSAFWDIAPGLLAIVQQVPQRLSGFEVLVPPQEYDENPAYHDYPLQYLYTLLAHAGRSAYQFIESQTNLLCLLHEVKTGLMIAGLRLLETQRLLEGEVLSAVDREMKAIRADEERRLTDDLKEKVGLVESQWNEALGQGMEDCKARVRQHLVEQAGWDDTLSE